MKSIDDFVKEQKNTSSKFKTIDNFVRDKFVEKKTTEYKADTKNKNQFSTDKLTNAPIIQHNDITPDVEPTWNGPLDNPITRTAGKGFQAIGTGFEKVGEVTGLNNVRGAIRGLSTADLPTHKADGTYLGEYKALAQNAVEGVANMAKGAAQGLVHPNKATEKFNETLDKGLKNTNAATRLAATFVATAGTDPMSAVPIPISGTIKGVKAVSSKVGQSFDTMFGKKLPSYDDLYLEDRFFGKGVPKAVQKQPSEYVDAFNKTTNEPIKSTMGNPYSAPENVASLSQKRITLGLPEGNYTAPKRLKVNNPTETLDYVMTKIKPDVMKIIEAPTRRDMLIKYVQKNTQVPINEIHNMPMIALQQIGQDVQAGLHSNMKQIAYDVAKRQGHDLPALLEGQAPTLRAQVARDAQSQVYGVQPPKVGIQKPNFNVTHEANVAMPETKIARPPVNGSVATPKAKPRATIESFVNGNKEVAATTVKPKVVAKVEPVVVKSSTVNPKTEFKPVESTPGIRANYRNQLENGNLSRQLKGKIGNTDQSYERLTNQGSDDIAREAVKNLPKAESSFLINESGGADHIATGYRLMQKLDDMGEHSRALVISDKLAKDLTKAGQTAQAARIISRLSPEGQLLNLTRQAQKSGKVVSEKDAIAFKEQAKIVQSKAGAGVKANQFTEILDRAAKGEKLTSEDIKKMSDYLSNAEKTIKPKVVKVVDELPQELKEPRKRDRIISYLDDAEQAALARIAARKSTLNAGVPIGEWKDHAIVVAAQITKGSIKAATHTEDLVKLFGESIRPVATQVFQKAQGIVKGVSTNAANNNMTKANASFERISGHAKEVNHQEKVVEKYLKENPKVSEKDIDTLRNLAKSITKLSSAKGIEADISMQKILNSYEKSNPWEKVTAVRYMAMLLNSGTQGVNAMSGPIMATMGHAADVFGTMVDVAMHATLKTPRSTTLYGTNPLRFLSDYMKNLFRTGIPAGWHGVNPAGIQNIGEIRGLTYKSNYNPLNWAERTLGAVAKGTDYAAYKTVFDSEIRKEGFLDAINSGIKRSDRATIKNHVEKFINEPSEKALLQADRIGKNTTFQRSDSTGGKIANFVNTAPTGVKPLVNAVIPFVRTPINIASTAVTMTPAGIIKGLFQLTSKSKASQREAIRSLSLGVTGSVGIGSLGFYLSQLGIITGANDSGDKDVNAIKEQSGQGKYRFNQSALMRYMGVLMNGDGANAAEKAAKYQEGDSAFDYNKFQPIAFPLAIGASLGKSQGKPLLGRISQSGADAYGSLFGMSTLKGVQDVFQPQYGGTQGEKSLGVASRIAESFFKSFSPSMLAQEARRQDPVVRKTPYNNGIKEDVKGYFQSRTPGLSQSLPANKTTLGMDKLNASGIMGQYVNPYKSEVAAYSQAAVIISDLIDKTGDNSLAPSAPLKKVEGKDRKTGDQVSLPIPQDRYEQLQEELGHEIILKILALDPKLTDAKKADKIKEIYEKARKKEMDKVKKEMGIRVTH